MVIRSLSMLLALTLVSLSAAQTTGARPKTQPATPPSIEQFMKIRAPNSPTLSPDGTLFVRDWPEGVNQLFMRAADRDGLRRKSMRPGGMNQARFGPHLTRASGSPVNCLE